ncbi:sodium channel subunit beta-4-like isoform X2 [Heptranchias perlo]
MTAAQVPLGIDGAESAKRVLVAILIGFVLFHVNVGLEVNIGKLPTINVLNGTDVLLPCTFHSCMDYKNSEFKWTFQKNKTDELQTIIRIRLKGKTPNVIKEKDSRVELIGQVKLKNISLLLANVDFEDTGFYTCFFKNPQEKNQEVNSTIRLIVLSEFLQVDNTLTYLILSIVGGVIGILILLFIIKKLVMFLVKQVGKKK